MTHRISHCLLAVALLMILAPATTFAASSGAATDAAALEPFFDGVMVSNMRERNIPGAAVVVVHDGAILFSKGYGYADLDSGTPVDPDRSLFRVGSISKLFTWTAVMQLVERGQIDLDADISSYLDFAIPMAYDTPITMRHLMSHTAGFEDRSFAIFAKDREMLMPHDVWLREHIPAQVREPGTVASYSNYGTSLAGYIVERVSGLSYDDYLDQHMLQPLEMARSTSRQPLPDTLADDMSAGYRGNDAQPFELLNIAPAGGISATAADMSHFMIAHLQEGRYGGERILAADTVRQMHTRHFAHDARLNGMAHGFWERHHGATRALGHGGDTMLFHSDMLLLIEENSGIFVTCNSAECLGFPQVVTGAFMHHFYPLEGAAQASTPDAAGRSDGLTGLYRSNRIAYTTVESLLGLLGTFSVAANANGELLLEGERFVEVEPYLFRQVYGEGLIAFRVDGDGNATHFFLNSAPPFAFERVDGLAAPAPNYAILSISLLSFLTVLLGMPLTVFARRGCAQSPQPQPAWIARAVLLLMVLSGLLFAVLVGITALDDGTALYEGFLLIHFWTAAFWVMVVTAVIAAGMAVLIWKNAYWRAAGRLQFTLVTLAAWALIWFGYAWQVLRL